MRSFDVVIVGAGIVGAACAASLSREGLSVAVIDAGEIATGTTAAGMGHLVVMDDSEAQFALTNYSRGLWAEIADELPPECEYQKCRTIWVAADEEEFDAVRAKYDYYNKRGVATEILDQKSLCEAEPNLAHDLVGGLLVTDDAVVYQLAATKFFIDEARRNGATTVENEPVKSISNGDVKLRSGETISAGKIINAAGADAARLSPQLNIRKRKGHLVITERIPGFITHQLIELGYLKSAHGDDTDSVAFNVQPRATGQVLVGSSRQFGAETDVVDAEIVSRMTIRAFRYMPSLKQVPATRIWTGFRPATPDNLPYIGQILGQQNVYAAAGHEGLGITTSLGTAELLTAEILCREPDIPAEDYRPGRLIG